jgi:hypothetical protein
MQNISPLIESYLTHSSLQEKVAQVYERLMTSVNGLTINHCIASTISCGFFINHN